MSGLQLPTTIDTIQHHRHRRLRHHHSVTNATGDGSFHRYRKSPTTPAIAPPPPPPITPTSIISRCTSLFSFASINTRALSNKFRDSVTFKTRSASSTSVSQMSSKMVCRTLNVSPHLAFFPLTGGVSRLVHILLVIMTNIYSHILINTSASRLAIKVKCSDNRLYRVSPVYSLLEPGATEKLQIVRDQGEAKVDKLVLIYREMTADETNVRDVFANVNAPSTSQLDTTEVMLKRGMIILVGREQP